MLFALWVCLALLAGCTPAGGATEQAPDPQTELTKFITHLEAGEWDKASAMTSDPGPAGQTLAAVLNDLAPTDLQIHPAAWDRTGDTTATIGVRYTWQLPDAGSWSYDATWNWRLIGSGSKARWTLDWSSSVVHPDLGAQQTLAVRTTDADPGALVDRNDRQILSPVTVYAVQASPRTVKDPKVAAARLVTLLKPYDSTLKADVIADGIRKADPAIGYTVINLRENEFTEVQKQLAAIGGLTFPSQVRNLGPTKNFARVLMSQVEPVAAGLSHGTSGWRIVSVDSTGAVVKTLTEKPPVAGDKVILTMDLTVQLAAEKALAAIPEPAAVVVIQPSSGEILAVAQNAAADVQGSIALTGQYPPGSIFKIVTATAAIDTKLATPSTVVPCPGQWTFKSRVIHNEGFELGDVPMELAFAKSCNTTFAQLASKLPMDALTNTAKQYGIGLDFVIPGITTLTGKVPAADSALQLAEDGFGQGLDLVTPFSAALMAATAATGNMPTPSLIRGQHTTIDQKVPPRSTAARTDIRTLMHAVVNEGTAITLQDVGTAAKPVFAKTGTAEFSDDKGKIHAHAWTVGFRGDLAFSALIVGGDSSKRTNEVLKAFLAAVPAK